MTMAPPRTLAAFIDQTGGRTACLALSRDPNAKVTILIFPPGAARPAYVAKVPTTDAAALSVEREAERLAEVGDRVAGPVSATIPELVATVEHLGRPVLIMTALPGQSMLAAYHSWRHTARREVVAADFAAAGDWLAGLQSAVGGDGQASVARMLDGVADVLGRRFGGQAGADADLAQLAALRGRLEGHRTPQSVVHGDFWAGNLLTERGRVLGVIDWEHARLTGSPVRDLARFATSYSLYLDRHTRQGRLVAGHRGLRAGRWGAGVDYAIDGTGWYPDLVRSFVRTGLERLGVSPSCWRDVLLADLATSAASADHDEFARNHLLLFRRLTGAQS
ncbi:MAG TPA: aminoglycoside phosphotransferase family protein [Streptosporangiaceae bacterium]|nr:aminoglycoside phosphotransferase family protein [Streptosporangiaceae bacterium]